MAEKNFVTELTAMNATETTKTQISSYTVPQGVTKLVEVAVQWSMAGLTTLEDVGGILEIECDDASNWGGTQQFLADTVTCVTSGAAVFKPTIHDCNIPVQGGAHLKFSVTCNKAQTINPSCRIGGKFV